MMAYPEHKLRLSAITIRFRVG